MKKPTAQPKEPAPMPIALVPWIRCIEPPTDRPDWQDQEWIRLDYRDSTYACDHDKTAQAANSAAKDTQLKHGGKWCGVVRPDGQIPNNQPHLYSRTAQEWAHKHILDGPDGPGRRWLTTGKKQMKMLA